MLYWISCSKDCLLNYDGLCFYLFIDFRRGADSFLDIWSFILSRRNVIRKGVERDNYVRENEACGVGINLFLF